MRCTFLVSLSALALLSACTQRSAPNMSTEFFDMSDGKFSLRAIAPSSTVRELAVCKAVWFAEKRNVASISLSNPAYATPSTLPAYAGKVPPDWAILTTTAYISDPNPDKNPKFDVAGRAPACRSAWAWYR